MKESLYLLLIILLFTGCSKTQPALPVDDSPAQIISEAEIELEEEVTPTPAPAQFPEKEISPSPSSEPSQTPEVTTTPTSTPTPSQEPKKDTITLYVKGKDGVIFPKTEIEFKENQTVFDLLKEVMRKNNIIVDDSGTGSNKYVEGIDNLYEFDHGAKSGWVYFVNGKMMGKSSGNTVISKNDKISWYYTLDLGNDIIPE